MAKFQRLGPVWRKPKPKPWKQLKNCARWANERQWIEEFDPFGSVSVELSDESGVFAFITENSNENAPAYFVLEDA